MIGVRIFRKAHPIPPLAMGKATVPSSRFAPSPVQPGLVQFQGWGMELSGCRTRENLHIHPPHPTSPFSVPEQRCFPPCSSRCIPKFLPAPHRLQGSPPPADPSGTRQSAHPEQQPARNPKRSRRFHGVFFPRNSWQQPKGAAPYREWQGGTGPGPGVPGVPTWSREAQPRASVTGAGGPGALCPDHWSSSRQPLLSNSARAAEEGNRKPQSSSPEPPAPTPAHELTSLAKRREWRFSRIRRKSGASRRRGRGGELLETLGLMLLVIFHLIRGEMNPHLPACPATKQHHARNVG